MQFSTISTSTFHIPIILLMLTSLRGNNDASVMMAGEVEEVVVVAAVLEQVVLWRQGLPRNLRIP